MWLTLISLATLSLIELAGCITYFRRALIVSMPVLCLLLLASSVSLISTHPSLWTVVLVFLMLYRVFNLLRLGRGSRSPGYVYESYRRAAIWLIAGQVACFLIGLVGTRDVPPVPGLYLMGACLFALSVAQLSTLRRHLRSMQIQSLENNTSQRDLPTVSVLVPARNETEDLEACLKSLIASTYPKLEIIVLDDCSQTSRTPEIIRSFAHEGVQFIAGEVPPTNWLAKNFAYQQLVDNSNGDILLFCGVDIRLSASSIRSSVELLLARHKKMLSIVPMNASPPHHRDSVWSVQTMRYAWELVLPRRLTHRPPVLSSCWLAQREALSAAGGFDAVRRAVEPERYFARSIATRSDGYSFLLADERLPITSHKKLGDQKDTFIRCRYPQLHKRIELVAALSLIEISLLLGPLVFIIFSIIDSAIGLAALAALIVIAQAAWKHQLSRLTYRPRPASRPIFDTVVILGDLLLLQYSMWKYEFDSVEWKGRNICIPVMRVIPRLPRVDL